MFKDITENQLERMKELLLTSGNSISEIARQMGWSLDTLNQIINHYGLNWAKEETKHVSKGQSLLTQVIKSLLPGEEVVNEYPIGRGLRVDVYCPSYRLAAEYHGKQHFYYTNMFYESQNDFSDAIERDKLKATLCEEQGIALVIFKYDDDLTEDFIYKKILAALNNSQYKKPIKSEYYENWKMQKRQESKKNYQLSKQNKKDRKK